MVISYPVMYIYDIFSHILHGDTMINSKNKKKDGALSIIIVGCGKVGGALVEQLSAEGHDITLIDKSAERLADLQNKYDVMGIVGNGASYKTLMDANIENTDLVIAVTGSDELNLLCCTVAKRAGDCSAIARVRTPDYSEDVSYLQEKLGLAMIINPELESANEIARNLTLPAALGVNPFSQGQIEMIRVKIPQGNNIIGKPLAELSRLTEKMLICAIERGGNVIIPSGKTAIEANDVISFIAESSKARSFMDKIGILSDQIKDVLIVGGGRAAFYLTKQLIEAGIKVTIIEKSYERCEELSELIPEAVIINGDGTNPDLLTEYGIENVDAFVAVTGVDEENIMLTLHARMVSKAKVITKISHTRFDNVMDSLDLESVVYPKYITSEAILAYVRAKKNSMGSNIETLYRLFDNRVEATEFFVEGDSSVIGVPFKELKLKDNLLITCINRGGQIILPRGNDMILEGDRVIVVTTHTGLKNIRDIVR